jgi:hypothetical protein
MSLLIHKRRHCRVPMAVGAQLPVQDVLGEWALKVRQPDADPRPFSAEVKLLFRVNSDLEAHSAGHAHQRGRPPWQQI